MATAQNPYQAYTEGVIFSDHPLNLVVALYQGALDATQQAERACLSGDITGRGKAINKANAILTELLGSLDHERGGEISYNLKRLYCYMQGQLVLAHARKSAEMIREVSSLLTTLLEGWRAAATTTLSGPAAGGQAPQQHAASSRSASVPSYGGDQDESGATIASSAYSF